MDARITFTLNGGSRSVTTDPRRPLLEVLREDLGLTGTKYGCGEGECRACTVLLNGESTPSCLTPIRSVDGQTVVTIEGLAHGEKLHPVQEAFLAEGAFQCGYCTSGMILGVASVRDKNPAAGEAEYREELQKHICRCGGYPKYLSVVRRLTGGTQTGSGAHMTTTSSVTTGRPSDELSDLEPTLECVGYDFGMSRRAFVKGLGAGLCIAVSLPALPQEKESGQRSRNNFLGSGAQNVAARIHLGTDGTIMVMAGKVEAGQGARAELLQAAAEELRVPVGRVQMVLADTGTVPDDGMTAGSGTTPRTVPAVRRGAATARNLLIAFACGQWTRPKCSGRDAGWQGHPPGRQTVIRLR